jgi:antitoxin ParD1/3/4/toxin ParE1/3/4
MSRRRRFVLTPEARADLIEIWSYIAGRTPGMGHQREDLADARHRFWTVYAYVIAYRSETIPIQIVAVVHGARQLEAFFQQRIQ